MATTIPRVLPGDLITSELWNTLAQTTEASIQDLEIRLSQLETTSGADAVVILSHSPAGPRFVGERLTLNGRNFSVPEITNVVRIGSTRVPDSFFRFGGSQTQLVFDIPDVPGLSTSGTPVNLTVQNALGKVGSYELVLSPAPVIPAGRVEAGYRVPPILPTTETNILANRSYIFGFRITAFASQPGNYRVTPTIVGAGWTAELLQDASDTPRSTNIIPLAANTSGISVDLRVRVTLPTGAAGSASLVLDAVETTPGTQVNPGSDTVALTIGSPPPVPETRVRTSLRSTGSGVTISGNRVVFPRNNAGVVTFNVLANAAALYFFQARMRSPAGWTPDPITLSVSQATIAAGNNQDVALILTPGSAAVATDILFTVSAPSLNPALQFEYALGASVA